MNRNVTIVPWRWLGIGGTLVLVALVVLAYSLGWTPLVDWIANARNSLGVTTQAAQDPGDGSSSAHDHSTHDHSTHDHSGHDHAADHSGPGQPVSIELTEQARKNLGLTAEHIRPVELTTYQRTIRVPAIVVARPGRTQVQVSSPLSGVVTHVHAVTGEVVMPGDLLFEVRLTYEDLVETQIEFIKGLSELDVENREVARLEEVTRSGAVSGKVLLERRYAKEKMEASLNSMREALKLHGLSDRQVAVIEGQRRLLRDLEIVAPDTDEHPEDEELHLRQVSLRSVDSQSAQTEVIPRKRESQSLVVEDLQVEKGQGVTAGDMLCKLSDFSLLYIEGQAFEQDAINIAQAAERQWPITAVFETPSGGQRLTGLNLAYVGSSIDPRSRTLSFFVDLPNEVLREETNASGQRFVTWKYRTGQRLQLEVPIEIWENQIVVPMEATVQEGAEWFVFEERGSHFDRIPVHVRDRDQRFVVIANDGSIDPGDVIALKSAYQMQMAIKNRSGAGIDSHAGHSH